MLSNLDEPREETSYQIGNTTFVISYFIYIYFDLIKAESLPKWIPIAKFLLVQHADNRTFEMFLLKNEATGKYIYYSLFLLVTFFKKLFFSLLCMLYK